MLIFLSIIILLYIFLILKNVEQHEPGIKTYITFIIIVFPSSSGCEIDPYGLYWNSIFLFFNVIVYESL
jgi:hypothetical protein